jgi:hypothetical protein
LLSLASGAAAAIAAPGCSGTETEGPMATVAGGASGAATIPSGAGSGAQSMGGNAGHPSMPQGAGSGSMPVGAGSGGMITTGLVVDPRGGAGEAGAASEAGAGGVGGS